MPNQPTPSVRELKPSPLLEELAKVVDYQPGWVMVEVELKSACNHCANNENCGTSAVAKAFSVKTQRFSIASDQAYNKNDMLKLGLPESVIIQAAALVYLLPLLGLFLFAGIGHLFALVLEIDTNLSAMTLALLGAVLSWRVGKYFAHKIEANAQPVIISNLGQQVELFRQV
ncbi:SoxR reducing system RseC family protein [Shewanella subflava]|uniref:SoxR reducing system RseC family protein n=1 Tax=Shewanella subflava TaxID=2986476 RepID=A0ABT3IBG6_9GAMM|nr:SoxR reducing system RseC family protein [Shewanella subflava]MCW3173383.1 SoxR reducing system RseC family protein [Shewanella subflava]